MVNDDFHEMYSKVKAQLPSLRVHHGGDSLPKKPRARVHPMVCLSLNYHFDNLGVASFSLGAMVIILNSLIKDLVIVNVLVQNLPDLPYHMRWISR